MSDLPPGLQEIAAVALSADLAALGRHRARVAAIQAEIEGLKRASPDMMDAGPTNGDAPSVTQIAHWHRWRDMRLSALQAELAAARAARETLLARTKRSFGRKAAIDALVAREMRDRARRTRP